MNFDKYFASYGFGEEDKKAYLDALLEKIDIYRKFLKERGHLSKWQRALQNYYGVSSDGTKASFTVSRSGDDGHLTTIKINEYRNLIQHQLILITAQRPAGAAKAINSDTESLHQARIGTSLVEYFLSKIGWEKIFVQAAEIGLHCDEAYTLLDWDQKAGDPVRPNPETGEMVMTGDPTLRVIEPWNMARDPYCGSASDMEWGIASYKVNKFALAAKYPNFEREILLGRDRRVQEILFNSNTNKDTDFINVYLLCHKPTAAVSGGRYTLFVPDAILLDSDFPYPEFNMYRFTTSDIVGTPFAYTNNNDLLAPEEVTDALYSAATTNNTTFATQLIVGPKGAGINHTQLAKGLMYLEVEPQFVDKIIPLNLTKTSPETYAFIKDLSSKKEQISGINSVVRGDPEGALRSNSGSALALIQAQSLQFNSGGQRSWFHLLSTTCTGLIRMLQRYADNERVVRITGKVQSQYLEEFKYDKNSLQNISSVIFEMVDPISQSIGGKVAAADNLLQKGLIKNARQYLTVMKTGSLDAFTEDDEADELAIKAENEKLRSGEEVQVLFPENHQEHIQGHMSVIADPESKKDPKLVKAVTDHILEHTYIWQKYSQENPALLIATKQQVLPPPPPPMGMGMPGGQAMLPPPPQEGNGPPPMKMPDALSNQAPVQTQAGQVKQPNMPTNPATGQKAVVPGAQ